MIENAFSRYTVFNTCIKSVFLHVYNYRLIHSDVVIYIDTFEVMNNFHI